MIRIEIEPGDADAEHYVLRVRDAQNGNVLLSSTAQGYNHATDAERIARRLFGGPSGTSSIAFAGGGGGSGAGTQRHVKLGGGGGAGSSNSTFGAAGGGSAAPEAVELVVRHRDGTHRTERIR
jgi:hypothetical protein